MPFYWSLHCVYKITFYSFALCVLLFLKFRLTFVKLILVKETNFTENVTQDIVSFLCYKCCFFDMKSFQRCINFRLLGPVFCFILFPIREMFLGSFFWRPNQYTSLQNAPVTTLKMLYFYYYVLWSHSQKL